LGHAIGDALGVGLEEWGKSIKYKRLLLSGIRPDKRN